MSIKTFVVSICIFVLCLSFTGCGANTFDLDEAENVLDISSELPASFSVVDAASVGFSKQEMGLGAEFSEVFTFQSETPNQLIACYLYVESNEAERAQADALMADDEAMAELFLTSMGLEAEGASLENMVISHPVVGDITMLLEGRVYSEDVYTEVDMEYLMFRKKHVYVYVISVSSGTTTVSLNTMGTAIANRIAAYQ